MRTSMQLPIRLLVAAVLASVSHTMATAQAQNRRIEGTAASELFDADVFVFEANFGNDTIADFGVGGDLLDLSALGISADEFVARVSITDDTRGTLISVDGGAAANGGTITLLATSAANISINDFILAPQPLPMVGGVGLASTVHDGEAELSNIAFIPESTNIAVLERKTGRILVISLAGGGPSLLVDISSRSSPASSTNRACWASPFSRTFANHLYYTSSTQTDTISGR